VNKHVAHDGGCGFVTTVGDENHLDFLYVVCHIDTKRCGKDGQLDFNADMGYGSYLP